MLLDKFLEWIDNGLKSFAAFKMRKLLFDVR